MVHDRYRHTIVLWFIVTLVVVTNQNRLVSGALPHAAPEAELHRDVLLYAKAGGTSQNNSIVGDMAKIMLQFFGKFHQCDPIRCLSLACTRRVAVAVRPAIRDGRLGGLINFFVTPSPGLQTLIS